MAARKGPKVIVHIRGERVTQRAFREWQKDDWLKHTWTRKQVIGLGLLTEIQLTKAIKDGMLRSMKPYKGGGIRFDKEEIDVYLQSTKSKTQQILFPA